MSLIWHLSISRHLRKRKENGSEVVQLEIYCHSQGRSDVVVLELQHRNLCYSSNEIQYEAALLQINSGVKMVPF